MNYQTVWEFVSLGFEILPRKLEKFENSLKLPGVLFSISLIIYKNLFSNVPLKPTIKTQIHKTHPQNPCRYTYFHKTPQVGYELAKSWNHNNHAVFRRIQISIFCEPCTKIPGLICKYFNIYIILHIEYA